MLQQIKKKINRYQLNRVEIKYERHYIKYNAFINVIKVMTNYTCLFVKLEVLVEIYRQMKEYKVRIKLLKADLGIS